MSKNKRNERIDALREKYDQINEKSIEPTGRSRLDESKDMIWRICESLNVDSDQYSMDATENTVMLLVNYFSNHQYFERLLYSEISAFIFSEFANNDEERMTNFESNVEKLMVYYNEVFRDENQAVANAVVKIYDHCALALKQKRLFAQDTYNRIETLQNDLQNKQNSLSTELGNAINNFNDEIRKALKDHITIFGVFSAIIITFVGGLSYSSSILERMSITSIFRLVFMVCLLGLVLFNTLYLLFYVILKLSNLSIPKEITFFYFKTTIPQFVNATLLLVMFMDCLLYYIHAEKIRDYIDFLPWIK